MVVQTLTVQCIKQPAGRRLIHVMTVPHLVQHRIQINGLGIVQVGQFFAKKESLNRDNALRHIMDVP